MPRVIGDDCIMCGSCEAEEYAQSQKLQVVH